MKGLILSAREQDRLQVLNGVLERHWSMQEGAPLLGVSERQGWRLLAATVANLTLVASKLEFMGNPTSTGLLAHP